MPPKYPPKKYYRWSEDLNKVLFAAVLKNHTIEVDKLIDNWPIDEAPPISRALRDHLLKIKNEGSALARQANEKLNAERKAEAAAHSRAEKGGDRPLPAHGTSSKHGKERGESLEKEAGDRAEKKLDDGSYVPEKWLTEEDMY